MRYQAGVFLPKFCTNTADMGRNTRMRYNFRQKNSRMALYNGGGGTMLEVFSTNTADMGGKFRPKSPFYLAGIGSLPEKDLNDNGEKKSPPPPLSFPSWTSPLLFRNPIILCAHLYPDTRRGSQDCQVGACNWKMPNYVVRKEKFWILLYKLL